MWKYEVRDVGGVQNLPAELMGWGYWQKFAIVDVSNTEKQFELGLQVLKFTYNESNSTLIEVPAALVVRS